MELVYHVCVSSMVAGYGATFSSCLPLHIHAQFKKPLYLPAQAEVRFSVDTEVHKQKQVVSFRILGSVDRSLHLTGNMNCGLKIS